MKVESPQHLSDVLGHLVELKDAVYLVGGGYHTHQLYPKFPEDPVLKTPISMIIDLSEVRAMRFHREESGWYILGSTLRLRQAMALDLIERYFPIFEKAIRAVGSVQMRNQTTLGGHLSVNRENDALLAALMLLDAKIYFRTHRQDATLSIGEFIERPRQDLIPSDGLIHKVYLPLSDEWKDRVDQGVNFYRSAGVRGGFWDPERAVLYFGRRQEGALTDNRIVLIRKNYPMRLIRMEALEVGNVNTLTQTIFDSVSGAIGPSKPITSGDADADPERSAVQMTGMILDGFIQELGLR